MKLNFQVKGNDLAARTIILYLLKHLPEKTNISWIKPRISQAEMSLCLSPECMQLFKYLEIPIQKIFQEGYGNLNCGAKYLFWPDINGRQKELFIPYFHEANLHAYPFLLFAKQASSNPSLLNYCLPQYTPLKEGRCLVTEGERGFEYELPLGVQVLSAPFFELIDSFIYQDKRLDVALPSEKAQSSDGNTLTLITENSGNKESGNKAVFESFSHFSHFGYRDIILSKLPSHQELYFLDKGYLNIHYLPNALSLNWVGSSYKSAGEITQIYSSLCSHAPQLQKIPLSCEQHRKIFHHLPENPWQGQNLYLSTHALSTLPQDFSLKLLFFSLDALFHFYPHNASFTSRFQAALEEIYSYFQLLFTPISSKNSFIESYQKNSESHAAFIKNYENSYGLIENWKLFSATPTLLQHLMSSRGLFPKLTHPSVDYQAYTPNTLAKLEKQMKSLNTPSQDNASFIQSLQKRSL